MRRRGTATGIAAPERLCRFVPGEWPAATLEDAFNEWRAARLDYAERDPTTVLGDRVDVMQGHVEARRRWLADQAI